MLSTSLLAILIRFIFKGKKDLFSYAILFYFYFSFGPIINHLMGIPIYFGTPLAYMGIAANIFTIAIVTMCLFSSIFSWKDDFTISSSENKYSFVLPVLVAFSIYAVLQAAFVILYSQEGTKIDKIAYLIPRIHYNYLMIQIYLVSFYFLMKTKLEKRIYWINFFSYIFYCIIVGERDFIFPLTSISLHSLLFTKITRKRKVGILLGISSLFFVGTAIFFIRDSNQVNNSVMGSVLNQGSLLFVNSYTAKMLDESYQFFNGFTYLNSIQNLLPSWIYKTDFNTLDWFKNNYAPGGNSGYGYGLDAEGYLNFGYIGVVFSFIFITMIQKLTIRNINNHDFFKFYSVFFMCFIMYSFRNDSLAFFKGNLYAVLFFILMMIPSKIIQGNYSEECNSNIRI